MPAARTDLGRQVLVLQVDQVQTQDTLPVFTFPTKAQE